MTEKEAKALYQKYQAGECTPEEERLLEATYLRYLKSRGLAPDAESLEAAAEAMWQEIRRHLPARRISWYRRWLPYAAAVLLVASVAGWWAIGIRPSAISTDIAEIKPGGNRATLTLADGRVINLDEAQTGIVVGVEDITYADGTALEAVILSGVEPSLQNGRDSSTPLRSAQNDGSRMLALTTPKGGTYQITLPDGSKVWLNAGSTLKYPSRFSGDSREVILEGEAYFEIKKIQGTRDTRAPAALALDAGARVSRVPFKVRTSTQTVEVLGTQFNISAYADEPETKTTLVEGSVRVAGLVGAQYLARNKSGVQLSPGQQSSLRDSQLSVTEVDVEDFTAWKDGYFQFSSERLESIMAKLARWYDVSVVFKDEALKNETFFGGISRYEQISEVLGMLETTEVATFRVEGRQVIIERKK